MREKRLKDLSTVDAVLYPRERKVLSWRGSSPRTECRYTPLSKTIEFIRLVGQSAYSLIGLKPFIILILALILINLTTFFIFLNM